MGDAAAHERDIRRSIDIQCSLIPASSSLFLSFSSLDKKGAQTSQDRGGIKPIASLSYSSSSFCCCCCPFAAAARSMIYCLLIQVKTSFIFDKKNERRTKDEWMGAPKEDVETRNKCSKNGNKGKFFTLSFPFFPPVSSRFHKETLKKDGRKNEAVGIYICTHWSKGAGFFVLSFSRSPSKSFPFPSHFFLAAILGRKFSLFLKP